MTTNGEYPEMEQFWWPSQFSQAYENAKTAKTRAKITAKRIEHFIATDGAE